MKNKLVIYFFALVAGIINGLFASGAGQIVVLALVYILHYDTYISRATSVFMISCITIISFIKYLNFVEVDIVKALIVCITALVFGLIGAKLMVKIKAKKLNIIAGILVLILGVVGLLKNFEVF